MTKPITDCNLTSAADHNLTSAADRILTSTADRNLVVAKPRTPGFRSRSQSVDCQSFGGVFDIDIDIDIDIDDNNAFESNSFSDDEDEASDDSVAFKNSANDYNSLNRGRNIPQTQNNAQNQSMAYSLPIQVPKWKNFHRHKDSIDDENVSILWTPEASGESISIGSTHLVLVLVPKLSIHVSYDYSSLI